MAPGCRRHLQWHDMRGAVTTSIPLPAGLPLDSTSWEQTPPVVRQVVVHLLAVIQQQEGRIAAPEARLSQTSRNSDRPPSSDPPYAKRSARSGIQGRPGAKPGRTGHRQALLAPTEVITVTPRACARGQQAFPKTPPYCTHQIIELPEIQMQVTHVVLHEARCLQCGRRIKTRRLRSRSGVRRSTILTRPPDISTGCWRGCG
jgi:transposase